MELDQAFKALGLEDRRAECRLLVQKFTEIKILLIRSRRSTNGEKELVRAFWDEHIKTHPNDTNDPIASLMYFSVKKGELLLTVRKKNFAEHLYGLSSRPSEFVFKGTPLDSKNALALSFGAVAVTKPSEKYPQGCIIFSKRGKTALNCGEYTALPGGYFNPTKDFTGKNSNGDKEKYISLEKAVERESSEELPGLDSYENLETLGLIYSCSGSKQPLIAISIKLPYATELAMQILRSRKPDWEVENYIFVPADIEGLKEFVKEHALCSHDVWKIALYVAKNL
ncbi:MAG: hypothetical protein PHG23_02035 [Candidatus Pacebacteria bacterium]|nr:hypothetical protein [Candidatus Paceibacterota bacterium]